MELEVLVDFWNEFGRGGMKESHRHRSASKSSSVHYDVGIKRAQASR
jgi:hypothetical protein